MKAHHLYSTATTLATAVLLAAPSLADQTISDTQTKAVNMTEGKLTVTGTGFLNVAKNAVNLKDPIQSALEIEVMEGGRISGKSALVLDQGMEKRNNGTVDQRDQFRHDDRNGKTGHRPALHDQHVRHHHQQRYHFRRSERSRQTGQ